MANTLIGKVWNIDTAGASPLTSARIRLWGVRWTGATTAGHEAIVHDKHGNIIWRSVANAANYVEADGPNRVYEGLIVPTLGSGTLDLEVDFEGA